MYGGDEVNALVLDVGSLYVKGGYAGDDVPKAIFPSVVGVDGTDPAVQDGQNGAEAMDVDGEDGDTRAPAKAVRRNAAGQMLHVGHSALGFRREGMEVSATVKDGLYGDMDQLEALWEHAISDRLRAQASEHAILLAEPTFQTREAREAVVTAMFEKQRPPAVFLAKNAVLASFATGRQTSLVVDAGHEGTTITAVHDGFALTKSTVRSPLGGALLSRAMAASVKTRGAVIRPRFSFNRIEKSPGQWQVEDRKPATTDSYNTWAVEQVAGEIKEALCRVSDSAFDPTENANIPTVKYELPDGTEIEVGPDRFAVPELLFNPALLSTFDMDTVKSYDGNELKDLPGMVADAISRCDVDIRRDMWAGIVLSGGGALMTGLRERLESGLAQLAPPASRLKVVSPANSTERRFAVWIGAPSPGFLDFELTIESHRGHQS
mmetsp:Transcript_3544/g.10296  ORF Transcript_3544/g.10296 Transcript_3544/m.10296 type:complete len:435 (+) Transcript_3544:267-1571(+)